MNEWQPIETAPKDGTAVWLWCEGAPYIGLCEPADPIFKTPDTWFLKAGFRRRAKHGDEIFATYAHNVRPTQWMPLPEPPK